MSALTSEAETSTEGWPAALDLILVLAPQSATTVQVAMDTDVARDRIYCRDREHRGSYRRGGQYRRRESQHEGRRPKRDAKIPDPPLTGDERDRRTVFVQQLAARLETKNLGKPGRKRRSWRKD